MLGAIAGDIIGSVYELNNITRTDFPLFDPNCHFTDDTVMTVAVADAILTHADYGGKLREWYRLYPQRGYGPRFRKWAASGRIGQGASKGNGSAMRVSPIGFAFHTLEEVLAQARLTAIPSHNTPEAIGGAQAVASAVFLARTGRSKAEIRAYAERTFAYDLGEPLDEIRRYYKHQSNCDGSVPQAITAFLESDGYEDAVRKAISIGGDSDTIACIAGGIAHAYYGTLPVDIATRVSGILDTRILAVADRFMTKYPSPNHR